MKLWNKEKVENRAKCPILGRAAVRGEGKQSRQKLGRWGETRVSLKLRKEIMSELRGLAVKLLIEKLRKGVTVQVENS